MLHIYTTTKRPLRIYGQNKPSHDQQYAANNMMYGATKTHQYQVFITEQPIPPEMYRTKEAQCKSSFPHNMVPVKQLPNHHHLINSHQPA